MRVSNPVASVFLPLILGLTAAGLAVVITALGTKFVYMTIGMALGLVVLLSLRTSHQMLMLLVPAFAFSLPLNLDINFLFRPHIGGAASISLSATALLIAALYIVLIYQYVTGQRQQVLVYRRVLVWATLIFMASGILSLVNALYIDLTILQLIRLLILLAGMVLIMSLDDARYLRLFVFSLSVAVLFQGIIASIQYFGHTSLGLGFFGEQSLVSLNIGPVVNRATGTIGHPNVLGYFFGITIPLMLALSLQEQRPLYKAWYFGVFTIACIGIFTTSSRGAWLTVPVSTFIVLTILFLPRIARLKSAITVFTIGSVVLAGLIAAYPTLEKRFFHRDSFRTASIRIPLNLATLSIIEQHPVVGIGMNNFSEVFQRYDTTGKSRVFTRHTQSGLLQEESTYKHVVHNLYLWVWAEGGTVGLLAFLWIFVSAFLLARTSFPRAPPWEQAVLVGTVAGMIGHLGHGLIDPGFLITPSVSMLIYCFFGLIGAISMYVGRQGRTEKVRG